MKQEDNMIIGCNPCRRCEYYKMCAGSTPSAQPDRLSVCEMRMSLGMSCGSCMYAGKCEAFTVREKAKKGRKKNAEK